MITYRIATIDDLPALADLRSALWAEDAHDPPIVDRAEYRRELARLVAPRLEHGELVAWVAADDGTLVASMFITRVPKVPKPSKLVDSYGYVSGVFTQTTHRNQGIGSELLRRVQAWALEQDLEFLVLWPSERSVPFYARAGFQPNEAVEFEVRPYVG